MVSQSIWEPLQGRTSLSRVFWVYGLGVSVVYAVIGLAVPASSAAASGLYFLGGLILGIYQLIALWQCAFNARSRAVGIWVRVSVAASFLLLPVFVYLIVTYPLTVAL
jgi:hypothetical protein